MKTVRLIREFKNAGAWHKPGAQLVLTDAAADWLVKQGVAELATPKTDVPALLSPRPSAQRAAYPVRRPCCGRRVN